MVPLMRTSSSQTWALPMLQKKCFSSTINLWEHFCLGKKKGNGRKKIPLVMAWGTIGNVDMQVSIVTILR